MPPSNNSEDNESTTSLSLTPPPPSSTLSSQEYVSKSMSTSTTGGIENLNPQNDPGLWPLTITDVDRTEIVLKGPIRVKVDFFPHWMIYSQTKDAVYCFPCRLFGLENTRIGSSKGVCDWKHLGDYLKSHESSQLHKDCMLKWLNLENGLKSCTTIDSLAQNQIEQERQRWRDILERLLAIVNFLASHNLAFRGHREKIISDSDSSETSGNFIDLVKLIARFDPMLRLHLKQVTDKTTNDHYLGKNIQNERIQLMASHVKAQIVDKIIKNKYYSIILDCTRDVSRVEQLSIIIRVFNTNTSIEEHFIGFLAVEKTTAESLTNYIITELEQLGISLQNCRGQGYDNGANMSGEKSGVQKRILEINPLAYFLPCGSHSYNLILGDAASSCVQAKSFFGLLQRLYTLFAGSSQRWAILKAHVKSLSLKPLSETRWECRVESVKAVKYQLSDICDALKDLTENTTDCQLVSECHSVEKEITTYEFVVALVVWYDILTKINVISKIWQSEKMLLDAAIQHLEAFTHWLDNYRENGFQSSLVTAREIAEENDIDRKFKVVRRRRKRTNFDYDRKDEALELSAEEIFKINYFYVIVDNVRASCQPRFEALKHHESIFGFMYNIKRLKEISDCELLKQCSDLQISLTVGETSDIDGHELYEELNMFIRVYEGNDDIISVLKYIIEKNLTEVYPTMEVVLRIIATTPVTVASAERSFSRLKIIKTYLRNSMTQDRLSALAILSIENDVAHSLDYSALIKDFSLRKSRKHHF
ncbi:zinc finger MYM-type protein 1-like [Centruroides sculpturatus]|uniref:zinc finger MYM-type protein 1-like n=1 Tax=Centruroides sculpturatus TaxID=218467 RepID=UPI000C6E0D42|nr:zinc finger MYM-type protein 1-like [Centruroides sculpturatus]